MMEKGKTKITVNGNVTVEMEWDDFLWVGHFLHSEKLSVELVARMYPHVDLDDIEKIASL